MEIARKSIISDVEMENNYSVIILTYVFCRKDASYIIIIIYMRTRVTWYLYCFLRFGLFRSARL